MEQMKVGIIGAGRIAANMAKTLDGMDDAAGYAIAARNLDRAQKFAKEWGFEKAYGSYEELVNDPEVELIYIATPHPFHIEQRLEVHILQVEKTIYCKCCWSKRSICSRKGKRSLYYGGNLDKIPSIP
mgnify:CR=1 FL=1